MSKFGFNARKLKPNTNLEIFTEDNIYYIHITDKPGKVLLQDIGETFPLFTEAVLNGSTSNGNVLKIGWIGKDMKIEFILLDKRITTELVKSVVIKGKNEDGEGWQYSLD